MVNSTVSRVKRCSRCGERKLVAEFSRHPQTRDGLQSQCRVCQMARAREGLVDRVSPRPCSVCGVEFVPGVASAGRVPMRCCGCVEAQRERRERKRVEAAGRRAERDRVLAERLARRCAGCGGPIDRGRSAAFCSLRCSRDNRRIASYGLTRPEYESLLERQGGVCAVCGGGFERRRSGRKGPIGEAPVVDHCHVSGRVRGVLHSRCNSGIGLLGDDFASVYRAAEYLAASEFDLRSLCVSS